MSAPSGYDKHHLGMPIPPRQRSEEALTRNLTKVENRSVAPDDYISFDGKRAVQAALPL